MTMSFQAHEGHAARSEDLHRHILRSHLAYLNQEETPAKLQQRRSLESLITEFLCVVSHSAKFTFIEIANILNCSIEKNPNFSAYKAQSAFEALEKYATNLISHPWRKEYKTVKLYSGFYKHSVESQLIQGNSVFHLLGYQYTEDGVLYLDEPVDPDKVARIALDCLIAYVECQVMVQICEKLKSFKCTWVEIYGIREDYVCGIDEAVRLLHQLKRNALEQGKQDRWLQNQENGLPEDKKEIGSSFSKTGILVDVSNTWPGDDKYISYGENSILNQTSVSDGPYKLNKTNLSHSKLPSWSESVTPHLNDYYAGISTVQPSKTNNSYASHSFDDHVPSNYSFLHKSNNSVSRYTNSNVIPDSWGDSWELMQPSLQSGSYYRSDSFVNCDLDSHRSGFNQAVPNVKETYSSQFGHMYPPHPILPMIPPFPYPLAHNFSIPPRQCQCRLCCENQLSMLTNKYNHSKECTSNSFESNLRSVSRSDVNAREDADITASLGKMSVESSNLKSRNFPVNTSYNYQTVKESSDVVLRPEAEKLQHSSSTKRGSYYDNVPSTFESENTCVVGQSLNSKCDYQSKTIPSSSLTLGKSRGQKGVSHTDSVANSQSSKSQKKSYSNSSFSTTAEIADTTLTPNLDLKNIKSNQTIIPKESKSSRRWSCSSCTFHNAPEKSICDMCGRSKHPGPEITPLVSGGRECPQCTLVNKKDSANCTACGTSLKDSPTYI